MATPGDLSDDTTKRGLIMHPDPDALIGLFLGEHDYGSLEYARQAYVKGDLTMVEFQAITEGMLERGEIE